MFSQATIYENMNKIVKLLQYKPVGAQTSLVPIECVASSSLTPGTYNLRKYSYFLIDNIQYTFINDQPFIKSNNQTETIRSINENAILYQGTVGEYPIYTAEGTDFESFSVVVKNIVDSRDKRFISHNTISVYVKEVNSGKWVEYDEVDNMYLTTSTSRIYDIRLNEHGNYEIRFGDGVFGKKLNLGDQVSVFYILSDGERGIISKNSINGNKLFTYNNKTFTQIYNDVKNSDLVDIDITTRSFLTFSNPLNSTPITDAESVDDIRKNTPLFLSSQVRLVTEGDYEAFLRKTIPSTIKDIKVINNKDFINQYIKYFYDICVDPNKVNRVILNQVNFADSCDFNNVNIFCVPKYNLTKDGEYPPFLSNTFKNLLVSVTEDKKMISNEVVPRDPVYIAIDLGFGNTTPTKSVYTKSKLMVYREKNILINNTTLAKRVSDIITNYFNDDFKMGGIIDIMEISSRILSLDGVRGIKTFNEEEGIYFNGLSFISWNPLFVGVDEQYINQNTEIPYFKYPYIYNPLSITDRIIVTD
jgi:hypothetical protein